MASTSPLMPTVSTSSSLAEAHLLPFPSAIIPTTQKCVFVKNTYSYYYNNYFPGNNLNTSVSSLETETRSLTTSNKLATLSNETQQLVPLPESVPTTSNSEHSNAPEILQCVKRNPRNRRKRPKVQKPEIEIKMTPHRPRKSAPTEYATDEEDMITYDVEEEELEPDPTFKFAFKESSSSYPNICVVWKQHCFPSSWREAIVIPILKPGKVATNPLSYRPIALTSCFSVRYSHVRIGHSSHKFMQDQGVPQGSVLSVTLFNIHMRSILHHLPPSVRGMLYVDDHQISCQGSDMRLIERQL
ncbi:reverse transcriptase domain-containing protein [Trichonephila clavipes]|nr:reverse transcriptase domain-containing protein [Trichonephila clavipes]